MEGKRIKLRYHESWKGDVNKSGGVAANIGVHFYDMLGFVFGKCTRNIVHLRENKHSAGYLEFKKAHVRWLLSVNREDLPEHLKGKQPMYRSITQDGFSELHTMSYKDILDGGGFNLNQVRPSIKIVSDIRDMTITPEVDDVHPFAQKILKNA